MRVLIVGRTKMGGTTRCIGGVCADGRSVRLLQPGGSNWHVSAPFQVGEVWEMELEDVPNPRAPHVENVIVKSHSLVGTETNVRGEILARIRPWQGSTSTLFAGMVGYTNNHNGHITESGGIPDRSTWFWIPDKDLVLRDDGKHYDYPFTMMQISIPRGLKYVGEPAPLPVIPAGTLVRVSLARWWKPDENDPTCPEYCFLQLSGWFS